MLTSPKLTLLICPKCRVTHPEDLDVCPECNRTLCDPEDLERVGLRLGSYEITDIVGVGGMGVVYRANHTTLMKPVAIKILNERYLRRRDAAREMLREAQAASRIRHPHIVDVFDFGTAPDGGPFFVMEYLEGESLNALLGRLGRLPVGRANRIVSQMAGALGAAHRLGIIHRDLKPENIFLLDLTAADRTQPGDFVKLLDFGLAKVMDMGPSSRTRAGMLAGTPWYMSPEQAQNRPVDPRSDIYSLGIVYYQMVTGTVPFTGDSAVDILMGHISAAVIQPYKYCRTIDDETNAVIMQCLEKDPDNRFQNMEELCLALDMCGTRLELEGGEILPMVSAHSDPVAVALSAPTVSSELGNVVAPAGPVSNPTVESDLKQQVLYAGEPVGLSRGDAAEAPGRPEPPRPALALSDALLASEVASLWEAAPRRRLVPLLAGASALVVVVAVAFALLRPGTHRDPPAPETTGEVELRLTGVPSAARVLLDGRFTDGRPIRVPRDRRRHTLRVEAEGYQPSELAFDATRDRELVFHLQPVSRRDPKVALAEPDAALPRVRQRLLTGQRRTAMLKTVRRRVRVPQTQTTVPDPKHVSDPKHNEPARQPTTPAIKTLTKKVAAPRPAPAAKKYHDWVVDPDL